jgi:hypothetical protein
MTIVNFTGRALSGNAAESRNETSINARLTSVPISFARAHRVWGIRFAHFLLFIVLDECPNVLRLDAVGS